VPTTIGVNGVPVKIAFAPDHAPELELMKQLLTVRADGLQAELEGGQIWLCGGPALYLFAYVALRVRVSRTLGGGRLIAAIACALLWPVAVVVPALVALTLVAIVWVGLHAYEIIWWREARARTRALRVPAS
jgi:low temperature requirement protein LtrA